MGNGFQFFDIIFFAMVAAFLVLRLRSVLGRRTGNERRRPDPFNPPPAQEKSSDNVVALPDRGRRAEEAVTVDAPPGSPLAAGLTQIKIADPSFAEEGFLKGACSAFEMIVGAFAAGNTEALRPLLSDEVYERFEEAIEERRSAGETLETTIVNAKDAEIVNARMQGRMAYVTVKFVTEQINVTRNADGQVVDGDPSTTTEVVDMWTFARDTQGSDPTWLLVATEAPS